MDGCGFGGTGSGDISHEVTASTQVTVKGQQTVAVTPAVSQVTFLAGIGMGATNKTGKSWSPIPSYLDLTAAPGTMNGGLSLSNTTPSPLGKAKHSLGTSSPSFCSHVNPPH